MSFVAEPAAAPLANHRCRLCGGTTETRFRGRVLGRHDIDYRACDSCGSLQTEPPYWLAEAYGSNLADLDTGAAQRCFVNLGASHAVARLFGLTTVIDVGGGDGLHCRLLRDHGLDAVVRDAHARPTYAQGFDKAHFGVPDLVTCFEVMEHFANPAADLEQVFGLGAAAVLASTERWRGQGPDWWYLAPASGQHVFFYSDAAIAGIAARFGYELVGRGGYLLFVRPALVSPVRSALARFWLRGRVARLRAALLQARQPGGPQVDLDRVSQRP